MNKSVIAPIVAVIALIVQVIFGVTIPQDIVDQIVMIGGNIAAVALAIYGIFKNHKKKDE